MSEIDDFYDIAITSDGDFASDGQGDLKIITGNDLREQHITVRLQNTNPDWFYDAICADLEDLLGLPNEKATALKGQKLIQDALTGLVALEDIFIQPVPINRATILYFVFVTTDSPNPMGFEVGLALGSSINVRRIR